MYLYERDNGKIITYELKENENLAKDYREKNNKLVLKATTINTYPLSIFEENGQHKFIDIECMKTYAFENVLNGEMLFKRPSYWMEPAYIKTMTHDIGTEDDAEVEKKVLDMYYEGSFKNKKLVCLTENDKVCHILLITDEYRKIPNSKIKKMQGIISLSVNLAVLHLLENEQFNLINDAMDISNPLQVFDFNPNPINSIEICSLEKSIKTKLINDDFEKIMDKVDETSKILQKVRKLNLMK